MTMNEYSERIKEVFDDQGISLPNWRIQIVSREPIRNRYNQVTDYETFAVDIYKYKCRKPIQRRILVINTVRKHIDLSNSTYINY